MNLSLGTAQFGSKYGVTNTHGIPSEHAIYSMLDMFFAAGNSFVDTAQEYGDAHKKISNWYKKYSLTLKIQANITTKIHIKNKSDIILFKYKVESICEELGLNNLYGVLIHNPDVLIDVEDCCYLNEQFKILKKSTIVKKVGVSVYAPQELLYLYDKIPEINLIQCPINILDHRFLQPEIQSFCMRKNIEIHARSLFLQGLLLSVNLPEKLLSNNKIISVFEIYKKFLKTNNLTAIAACCLFAYQNRKKIARWVVGFNFPSELEEFILQVNQIIDQPNVSFDTFVEKSYIDPRTWSYEQRC
jgi:aryl-alcohol dehydrogenase-like predicted oxidoreductase